MRDRHLAFIDTETTGLKTETHEIIQIGGVIVRQLHKDGSMFLEVIEEFELQIKPEYIEKADPEALAINGYTEEKWKDALSLKDAMEILSKKTKGTIMVAHNVAFDWAFIEQAFENTGIPNRMHYHRLDTIAIAFAKLYHTLDVQNFSLRELCRYFNIENKNAHTALSDARATYELFKKLMDIPSSPKTLF